MNKTLSVNIGGIVFHIEEQAFDRLNKYLDAIKGYFTMSDGRDEIIQDIEGRIGEMFQERISNSKQVIVDNDVEQVIDVMGRPEQFAAAAMDDEAASLQDKFITSERRAYRKLYRDPDNRVIGGVCSGFGHYMNIDPLWIRLAFAVAFFFFGTGLLLYIILVLVMPKAMSTSEKLEMKGERVNISNISRSVVSETSGRSESGIARFFDALGELLIGFFRLLGKIIAVIFVIFGIMMLIGLITLLLGLMGVAGISIPIIITEMFMEPWQQTLGILAAFLVLGIPLILLIFKAIRMLFKVNYESKMLNWLALALWITGVVFSFVVIISVASEFSENEKHRVEIPIAQPSTDTLFLEVMHPQLDRDERYYTRRHRINDPWSSAFEGDTIRIENVELDVIKSTTGNFELVQINSAHGTDRKTALENARHMSYSIDQQDSLIRFDESFLLPRGRKYRDQEIQLVLKVPVGKSIYLSQDMEQIIYDIKNVTNTYDGYMVGKTWTMTEKGLECIGCNLEEDIHTRGMGNDIRIRIDGKGVNVHGIDESHDSSFNIDGDDVKINIDDNGIQIDAKKK